MYTWYPVPLRWGACFIEIGNCLSCGQTKAQRDQVIFSTVILQEVVELVWSYDSRAHVPSHGTALALFLERSHVSLDSFGV